MFTPINNIDVFNITPEVLVANTSNFGINIENRSFQPNSLQKTQITNSFSYNSNFEPIYNNHTYTIRTPKSASFLDRIVENWDNSQSTTTGGISWYGFFPTDYFLNARLKIYRKDQSNKLVLIHTATCISYTCTVDGSAKKDNSTLVFSPPLNQKFTGIQVNDIIFIEKYFNEDPLPNNTKYPINKHGDIQTTANAKWTIDSNTFAPSGNSRASLKVSTIYTPPNYIGEGVFSFYIIQTPTNKYFNFIKGKQYSVSVWLKQQGLSNGTITMQIGSFLKKDILVTDKWQKFEFDLQMTNPMLTNFTDASNIKFYTKSTGTFWIDNFEIFQKDVAKNDILPYIKTSLELYKPGCIRIWTHYRVKNMTSFISPDNSELSYSLGAGKTTNWSLGKIISLCLSLNAKPWIILHPLIPEEDINLMMEYLFGPPNSPYGSLRAEHGYYDPFNISTIYFECGNETWNSIFAPLSWFTNVTDIQNYVGIVNRFTSLFKSNKYYNSSKIKMVGNGAVISPYKSSKPDGTFWPQAGYSLTVAQQCQDIDMIDFGAYYYLEDHQTRKTLGDNVFFSKYLYYTPRRLTNYALMTSYTKRDAGHNIDISIYEGGPNYPTPSPTTPFNQDAENLGKSFASAIVTLNSFLYLQSLGHKEQNYYQLSCDGNWGSHADSVFQIPHPNIIALSMKNNYCSGDMLKVDNNGVKKIDFPSEQIPSLSPSTNALINTTIPAINNIPVIDCYVYKNNSQLSILFINRSMNENRNVQIVIPYNVKSVAIKHYFNTPDVSLTNLNGQLNMDVIHTNISDFSNVYSTIIDKHSITIFVADIVI